MSILLMTEPIPAQAFAPILRALAPEEAVAFADAPHEADQVEAILAWRMKPGVLPRYPRLRVLCSVAAGVDKLLAAADLPPTLTVTRAVDPSQQQRLAQYVVACALRHVRELPRYAAQQAAGEWLRHPVRPVGQCRVGVLGLGEVGQAIARAFLPLGFPVSGWARTPRHLDGITVFAGAEALPAMLAQTDLLVCALPLTAGTQGLLQRRTLCLLPAGAYLINIGRGEQLVERDLQDLLDEGHLAGAALDVFEREPVPAGNWVWQHPRILATPHIAGEASREVVVQQMLDALRRARAGLPQPLAVDRQTGY
jgi:D-3-phosphoglycerate dehydrogenase/glyoxylate/hydroxypyruvate reductase A